MAPTLFAAGSGQHSFRHDPRMRQALARLGREASSEGPAGTTLYWLLRSRRPQLAALSGRISQADLLVVACALADCGAKLVVDGDDHGRVSSALAAAGMDWILRSGDCLPCLKRVRPYDCLIVGEGCKALQGWRERLGRNALLLGLGRNRSAAPRLADRLRDTGLADEIAQLSDGRRCLLIADYAPD
jgi:hypothetical protein